jgi:hypothetical protein
VHGAVQGGEKRSAVGPQGRPPARPRAQEPVGAKRQWLMLARSKRRALNASALGTSG